ncbi:MAG: hypothetical protein M1504_03845 [Candidatus Marsarchaeota archaeon]|nr:hypothetical protein [Candidatus Marsarchaeota archaeon]
MSFEKFLDLGLDNKDFNKTRFTMCHKERQNISKVRLDSDSGCRYTITGDTLAFSHEERLGTRYIAALSMSYDVFLTIFDINNSIGLVSRFLKFEKEQQTLLKDHMKRFRRANLEARVIGMQNDEGVDTMNEVNSFIKASKLQVNEIDLFGNEFRNIAIDLKTGLTFDVLVENRQYKPGELINKATQEQVERESIRSIGAPIVFKG